MVMHSNERRECCPRTLVDRKRKRYDNAVDVVVCLHDPTDPSTERTAPPSLAHVQLDDVPRTPIQQSFTGEFRHHAVVLTELLPVPLLDWSSGCVIELYVCQELGGAGVTVLGSVGSGG